MGPPSYMWSVNRNVVIWCIAVFHSHRLDSRMCAYYYQVLRIGIHFIHVPGCFVWWCLEGSM